jgi:hypothetical protein
MMFRGATAQAPTRSHQRDLPQVLLKPTRLILVAAHYRKEVTNTVLWLSQFGVNCQCFKVTPWKAGDELFLNVEQIIPLKPPTS